MFQTSSGGGGSTGQPKAQRKPNQPSNRGGGPGGYIISPMNPMYGQGAGAAPPAQPMPAMPNGGGGGAPADGGGENGKPAKPISPDPGDAYTDIFLPGALRAQQMLRNNEGFQPINMAALPGIKGAMDRGLQDSIGMARQGLAEQQALQGAEALGGVVSRGGMGVGTAMPLSVMESVTSGDRRLTTDANFMNIFRNPKTPAQQRAQRLYGDFARGVGDVGTERFDRAAAGRANFAQTDGLRVSRGIAGGESDVGTGRFDAIAGQNAGPSYSERNLADMATMEPGSNPYLDELENLITDRISTEQRRAASAAGRGYGSGYESATTADRIARAVLEGRLSQYNMDANRQLQANQQLDQQRLANANLRRGLAGDVANVEAGNVNRQQGAANALTALGNQLAANQLSAAGSMANIEAANRGRQMTAAQNLGAAGQQARQNQMDALSATTDVQGANIANAVNTAQAVVGARQQGVQDTMRATALQPEVLATRYADADRMTRAGQVYQDRRDTNFADLRDRRYEQQQAPWQRLAAYMSATGMNPQAALNYQAGRDQLNAQQPSGLQQAIGTAGMVGGALNQAGVLQPALRAGSNVIGNVIGGLF